MRIYTLERKKKVTDSFQFPCFVLRIDGWDDYTYKTTYDLSYHKNINSEISIGIVKILERDRKSTDLPQKFTQLNNNFCSLGQDLEYYENLYSKVPNKQRTILLKAINDVVNSPAIRKKFEGLPGFTKSLLRSSAAEKALREAKRILNAQAKIENDFTFIFNCRFPDAESEHELPFDFTKDPNLPFRIVALVGKNGTGKTQVLSRIANALSGQKQNVGEFYPERPPFDKVIAISYSAFDTFDRPKSTKGFLYIYCGLKQNDGLLKTEDLINRIEYSLQTVCDRSRLKTWKKSVSELLGNSQFDEIENPDFLEELVLPNEIKSYLRSMSSGQILILSVISEILAYISEESLILFDEPEMHLHPNAISVMMKCLNSLLEQFNSYAVVSTHSPIILQEIPSKSVVMIERIGNIPRVSLIENECFGQNISTIVNDVFRVTDEESAYKIQLQKLASRHSQEEVLGLFDEKLSLNARMYLASLYTTVEDDPF